MSFEFIASDLDCKLRIHESQLEDNAIAIEKLDRFNFSPHSSEFCNDDVQLNWSKLWELIKNEMLNLCCFDIFVGRYDF